MNKVFKHFTSFTTPLISKKLIKSNFHLKFSQNSYCVSSKIKYHPEIEKEINNQIGYEHEAGFKYLSFANHFGHVNLSRKGFQRFFMKLYEEEMKHANDFIKYQLLRGGMVCLNPINPYHVQEKTIQEFFDVSLQTEIEITKKLENIIKIAEKHNDIACADYITSKFINEQITSINEIGSIISLLREIGNSKSGLYIFDLELEKR